MNDDTKRLIEACCDNPYDDKSRAALEKYIANLHAEVAGLRDASQIDQGEIVRLKALCLEAAGYIGVRQGPELDVEADDLMRRLRGEV